MSNELTNVKQNGNSLFPSEKEWQVMREQANVLLKSNFLPNNIKTPEQALTIMCKGRELNIPAMQALTQIYIVNGKPSISAELMMSLIYKNCPSCEINFLQIDDDGCKIQARRNNKAPFISISFTIEDAKKANLLSKDVWKTYTRAMLRSRAVSEMARSLFPDAISGLSYTPEELGAEVNIDSNGAENIIINNAEPEKTIKEIKPVTKPAKKELTPEQQEFKNLYNDLTALCIEMTEKHNFTKDEVKGYIIQAGKPTLKDFDMHGLLFVKDILIAAIEEKLNLSNNTNSKINTSLSLDDEDDLK